ncbi:MAG: O-acetyl-ADP-ribose deacetylase [Clostridiales bacterium]|nr:O-acetyl-ADP-ribose deacetylase [Eubacteriales bacterium]MDH7566057.1 O-acetyl-ADP-ribose deacetylase [Clostridiales bacterium]
MGRINIILGDITKIEVDAVVNAANNTLLGGGGVDGAIHRAAGPELLEECRRLNGCETGEAKITKGYNLPAKFVIHTVGPVWHGGNDNEDRFLAACYRNSLRLAVENGIKTIAFPSISTGAYRFPVKRAARIALLEISRFLEENSSIDKVFMVCFDEGTMEAYDEALKEIGQ